MNLSLSELHAAIRPQFVWLEHNSKDLQTDPILYKGEGAQSVASIVFIGIAFMNGFKPDEICDYLNMGMGERGTRQGVERRHKDYYNKLSTFKTSMRAALNGTADTMAKTIFVKTSLTLNHLKNTRKTNYVPLTGFKF